MQDRDRETLDVWRSLEVWVDPTVSPPYLLLVLDDESGTWRVVDPKEGYRTLYVNQSYDDVKLWLLEDEYERVEGRLDREMSE